MAEQDYKDMEKAINNYEGGTISRQRFLDYLRDKMGQLKTNETSMAKQLEAANAAAKATAQTMQNAKQGVGSTQNLGAQTDRT